MPLLKIQTNLERPGQAAEFLREASRTVSEMLGKPERYVMVSLACSADMIFAGDPRPTAYLELKSIGLPQEQTAGFSETLCRLLEQHLEIPPERVYIEFSDAARHLWGWNGRTF
jgi:phenylpyruvate tautomerase PptA (4-oxalocrotonate tautomerase family)